MVKSIIPMAAAKVDADKIPWNDPDYIAERKYDGSRYLMYVNHVTGGGVPSPAPHAFRSRQVSKKTGETVDKTDNVPHLNSFTVISPKTGKPVTMILDGEIITDINGTSSEVTSVMGSAPDKAIEKQQKNGWVKYVVFDILEYDGRDLTGVAYYTRRKILETVYKQMLSTNPYILLAEVRSFNKEEWYNEIVANGGEGVILKNSRKPYVTAEIGGKEFRNKDTWIKVKKYDTYDVVVMGYTEPTKEYTGKHVDNWPYWETKENGRLINVQQEFMPRVPAIPVTRDYYYGWIGAVRFGQYEEIDIPDQPGFKGRRLVEIGQTDGMSDEAKVYFTDNGDELIGKVIEVGAMEQIKGTGALRHPRFLRLRPDKNPEQCILGVN